MMTGFERYTQEDQACIVSGRDGAGGAVAQVVRADRAALSESRQRAAAGGSGADAADLFFAAVVQPVGPGSGRGAVRLGGDAAVRGHRSGAGAGAGRDHGVQVPPLAGRAQAGREMLETVNLHLQEKGVRISTGTIVDATIIPAPSSTKNREEKRDPEMHQTKKGEQWYFGMKAHVGVDSQTKIIHSAVVTAANLADAKVLPHLLHGEETGFGAIRAMSDRPRSSMQAAPRARDCTHRRYRYQGRIDEVERAKNRTKSSVRSKVEHVFQILKLKFGFVKVRYRGLQKNANRLFASVRLGQPVSGSQETAAPGGSIGHGK